MPLLSRRAFIFDLDGTLAAPAHDFAAIKRTLGLPEDEAILESIASRPVPEQAALHARLYAIEAEIAERATPMPDAIALLRFLHRRGARVGVLTRNARPLALISLDALGLRGVVDDADVVGRDEAAPKPAPDGILGLLARWGERVEHAVMIGDGRFDVLAGRAAGVMTVWVRREEGEPAPPEADLVVDRLDAFLPREARGGPAGTERADHS